MDDALVVIDKPAGLLVHPSKLDAHESRSALEMLEHECGQKLYPLHRLDKGTSGVLMFGRNADVARDWGGRFERGEVRKRYIALVRGWPPEDGTIEQPLARDPELPSTGQARLDSVTRFRRIAALELPFPGDARHETTRCALVEVEPLTGRRHQIRRHFKHIAHPLIGDSTHGKGPLNRAFAEWSGIARLWLHASSVEAQGLRITADPGPEWERFGALSRCKGVS